MDFGNPFTRVSCQLSYLVGKRGTPRMGGTVLGYFEGLEQRVRVRRIRGPLLYNIPVLRNARTIEPIDVNNSRRLRIPRLDDVVHPAIWRRERLVDDLLGRVGSEAGR